MAATPALNACVNPFLIDGPFKRENHAPTVVGLEPAPSFAPLPAKLGAECELFRVRAARLFDPDLDPLTVRFNLLLSRDGAANGAREQLFEDQLVPVTDVEGNDVYDFVPFELSESLLRLQVGGLNEQIEPGNTLTQLLELRISDGSPGFVPGTDEAPEGAALLFFSWLIDLDDTDCTVN